MRDLLSQRAANLEGSSTILMNMKAEELKRKGVNVLSLAVGEPDFPTPDHVKLSAKKAIDANFTKYTPSPGIPELRDAIAEKTKKENGIPCESGHVLVTPTKLALFNSVVTLINPGDEVLMPDPCFVSYAPQVKFAGGVPVYVPTDPENAYTIRADEVQKKITKKTKLIMLCSPSNPTGGLDDPQEIKGVVDLANDHDFAVLSDEIYEKVLYEGKHVSPASLPGGWERTITINGLSKSFSMTGWRAGWLVAPPAFYPSLAKVQTQTITHITSFVQKAMVDAIRGPQDSVKQMVTEFKARRELVLKELSKIPGWETVKPKGAFYVWPKFTQKMSAEELCTYLLEDAHVALVPGNGFGPSGKDHVRISYAASREILKDAFTRIRASLEKRERKTVTTKAK